MKRKCCRCLEIKDLEEFHRDKNKKLGRRYYCKECANRDQKKFNKNRNSIYNRNSYLNRVYNINETKYNELYQAVDGCCEICGKFKRKLFIDHDHKTGRIRGLLCLKCNAGIGLLQDSPKIINNALKYLKRKE